MIVEQVKLRDSFAFYHAWGSAEEHALHVHDCLEIGVVLQHHLEYRFGDHTYHGGPGDVFLCRPFEPHWGFAKPGEPSYECVLILFTPSAVKGMPDGRRLLMPFYTKEAVSPHIPGDSPFARAICAAAKQAVQSQEREESLWPTRQFMHLAHILLQVSDYAASQAPGGQAGTAGAQAEVTDSIGFLLEHYTEPLDGETLLERINMGKTKFYHEFRTLTGLSPNEFTHRLRVQHAMDLLRSTRRTIIDIAESSGFGSLSTFNKQFKRYTEVSPREYRARFDFK